MTEIDKIIEEFKQLGGDDDFLEATEKADLPKGHLTRGFCWPETMNELDPDLIIDWLRVKLAALLKEKEQEIISKYKEDQKKLSVAKVSLIEYK